MSDPKNHHWLPRFLLREWASGSAKKVMCFHRPHSNVVISWQGIKKIGSTERLYTASWTGFKNPNFLETDFMTKLVDTPAAQIHRRMLHGEVEALEFVERACWSYFMLMLRMRHPDTIQPMQDTEEESWKKTWVEFLIGKTPTGYARPLDQAGAEAFYDQHRAGSGRDLVLQAIVREHRSIPFFNDIMNLEWRVLRLQSAPIEFLLADNPITMWGEGSVIKGVSIPLSPDALFIAADHNYFSQTTIFDKESLKALPYAVIQYQFKQARKFVIGRDQGADKNRALARLAEEYLQKRNE